MNPRKALMIFFAAGISILLYTGCGQSHAQQGGTGAGNNTVVFGQLPVPQYGQQTGMWCWAASTEMILGYYGITVQQCALADSQLSKIYKGISCCGTGCPPNSNSKCVHGGSLMVDHFGFTSRSDSTPLSWETIRRQIDSVKSPMGYSINTPKDDTVKGLYVKPGGHVRVIRGYIEVNGNQYVLINDPMPVCQGSVYPISYNEYAHGRGNWLKQTTTYHFTKK